MSLVPYKVTALKRIDTSGLNIVPDATVSVTSGASYAQLWEEEAGNTPIANPFDCDNNGEREFWILPGEYLISVAGGQSWTVKISGGSDVLSVATFADLATTPAQAGQVFYVLGATGGKFDAYSATVTSDGFYNSPSATVGVAFVRRTVNAKTRTLPDLAALRLVEGAVDGDIFEILEHTTGLGYGGGKFIVDSTIAQSDDDGIFIECVDTKLQRKFNGAVCTSFYGVDGTTDDYVKIQAAIAAAYVLETSVCINRGNNMLAGSITISTDNLKIYFEKGSYLTPTTDATAILISADDIELINPKIVTAGYGADNAGLIQITSGDNIVIREPVIESDKAAANTRTRVYNGIATAICSDVRIYGGLITGTPKSGVHISTASRNVKCYGTTVKNTGNHATGTYGFTPGFDSGGYGDNGFYQCRAEDTQGEFFLIMAENNATYGDQLCFGNAISNCSGKTSGKGAIRVGTLTSGVTPQSLVITNSVFETIADSGMVIGAGIGYSSGNTFKNVQNAGVNITSDVELIVWNSESDTVENFCLVDNANQNGFLIGRVSRVNIISPNIKHDFVGVTAGNIYGVGVVSGKTATSLRVLDPDFNSVTQPWRIQGTITSGHFRYTGAGAPGGSNIPNSSIYFRNDGGGATDNIYKRVAGAWTGFA